MTLCIIIRGPAGVGKTTVAQKLAARLDAHLICIDDILAKHHLDQIDSDGIPTENFIKGNELILPDVTKRLKRGQSVVIEGCFYREGQLDHLIENLPVKLRIFTLKASREECLRRNKIRKRPLNQKDVKTVYHLVSSYNVGIPIDTEGKTADEVVDDILAYH